MEIWFVFLQDYDLREKNEATNWMCLMVSSHLAPPGQERVRGQKGEVNLSTAVFIDGGYLTKILRNHFNSARINYHELARWAADGDLLRAYYYDCLPWQSPEPTPEEQQRFGGMQRFFTSLRSGNRMTVREGRLERREVSGVPYFVQKRIDLQIGLDIATLIAKGRVATIVLVAGDSDLLPAVESAKHEGVIVKLVHGPYTTYHTDLWQAADERAEIDWTLIDETKLEATS